jgi:hypothetical protein
MHVQVLLFIELNKVGLAIKYEFSWYIFTVEHIVLFVLLRFPVFGKICGTLQTLIDLRTPYFIEFLFDLGLRVKERSGN